MTTLISHYSVTDIEARILAGLRAAGLDPDRPLTPEELAPLDHFHTGGLASSLELLQLSGIKSGHRVLDIGAGLAGCARLMADSVGCRVDCVEMSADYCTGATLLNRLTGLEDRIEIHQCSALALPFAGGTFDAVWMQNVGMNIENKAGLYVEISRVLKPGGCFAFQEISAGEGEPIHFPLPWATEPGDSFLVTAEAMAELAAGCGLEVEILEDINDAQFSISAANSTPAGADELGLAVYVDDLGTKAGNARRSMEEGRIRLVRGIFRRTGG